MMMKYVVSCMYVLFSTSVFSQTLTESWYERWMKESKVLSFKTAENYTMTVKYFLSDLEAPVFAIFSPDAKMLCHEYVKLGLDSSYNEKVGDHETQVSSIQEYSMVSDQYPCNGTDFMILDVQLRLEIEPKIDVTNCNRPYGTAEYTSLGDYLLSFEVEYMFNANGQRKFNTVRANRLIDQRSFFEKIWATSD